MSIEDTPQFQARLAAARAKTADAMLAEEDRLRREYPGRTDSWYSVTASQTVQRANQRARSAWNPLSWF